MQPFLRMQHPLDSRITYQAVLALGFQSVGIRQVPSTSQDQQQFNDESRCDQLGDVLLRPEMIELAEEGGHVEDAMGGFDVGQIQDNQVIYHTAWRQ